MQKSSGELLNIIVAKLSIQRSLTRSLWMFSFSMWESNREPACNEKSWNDLTEAERENLSIFKELYRERSNQVNQQVNHQVNRQVNHQVNH